MFKYRSLIVSRFYHKYVLEWSRHVVTICSRYFFKCLFSMDLGQEWSIIMNANEWVTMWSKLSGIRVVLYILVLGINFHLFDNNLWYTSRCGSVVTRE